MRMSDPAVTAHDPVVSYGGRRALDRSSFSIPRGRITAVIGPNGAGKSTLLSAIAGLVEPESGALAVHASGGHKAIAYVLQSTKVNSSLPVTAYEVVMMGRYSGLGPYRWIRPVDRAAVDEAMDRAGVSDLAPLHMDELSGGQQQRVFVAQGLAQEHSILLLDEPLTGIDLPTAQAIDAVIHDETSTGCTVVMTTHDLSEAQFADHVLLLAGRVVASGSPEQVLTRDFLVEAYGPSLLHIDDGGRLFLDDPAHTHMPGRHAHRERIIHTEPSPHDTHGGE